MGLQFQFVGFTPRQGFKEKANEALNDLAELVPSDSSCSARVVMIDGKFFFQVMFVSRHESFLAKDVLDPKKEDISDRGWQTRGIEKVAASLLEQVEAWRYRRDAA
jgi:hypothetical protein